MIMNLLTLLFIITHINSECLVAQKKTMGGPKWPPRLGVLVAGAKRTL